ncbi:DUF1707 SHOCT-like domain-containing protein [Propionibacteriaceae bacterium Y2011]|uniref:DUF1707 SHOCT-like domain-containing protein n=1 Tax=Microlunatus sp. Y2014 TaxID=3418488 RepID=UPI003B4C345A
MSSDHPEPSLRIGNAERDEAVQLLQQQEAEGRLDRSELAERTQQVRAARTRDDLFPAFAGLPVDVPAAAEPAEFPLYPGTDPATGASTPVGEGRQLAPVEDDRQLALPDLGAALSSKEERLETSPAVKRTGAAVMALLWPAVFVINMIFGWHLWWLFFIPVFASGWIAYVFGLGDRPGGRHH